MGSLQQKKNAYWNKTAGSLNRTDGRGCTELTAARRKLPVAAGNLPEAAGRLPAVAGNCRQAAGPELPLAGPELPLAGPQLPLAGGNLPGFCPPPKGVPGIDATSLSELNLDFEFRLQFGNVFSKIILSSDLNPSRVQTSCRQVAGRYRQAAGSLPKLA